MSAKRAVSIALVILIAGCFAGMIISLLNGNNNLFFILGGVLVGLVILALVVLRVLRGRDASGGKETNQ